MANQWFRFYNEVLNDQKVQSLPLEVFKIWVNLLCLASTNGSSDGYLGTLNSVSFALRETEGTVSSAFHTLISTGIIETDDETFHIAKWKKRQYKSDTSTERVKRFRNRSRNVTETPQSRAEQIQSRAEANGTEASVEVIQIFDAVRAEVWGQAQARLAPSPTDKLTADGWLKAGISPAFCQTLFRHEMTKMHSKNKAPPRSLKFFDESIREAMASGKQQSSYAVPVSEESLWRSRLNDWKAKGFWLPKWGESPTSQSCRCPREILAEFGIAA